MINIAKFMEFTYLKKTNYKVCVLKLVPVQEGYYELMAEKIYKIGKELEGRRNRIIMSGQQPNRGQ